MDADTAALTVTGDVPDGVQSLAGTPSPAPMREMMATLDVGDEYFWSPERLVPFEHWAGHIPFAFWIIKALKPRSFVELGTHRGNSYCAMCQAVRNLGIEARGYAVDTWQGDVHMAFEGGLLNELRSHHEPRYASFSTLMPMSFDDARTSFADGSIDLLHIDGTHTYEAVKHDFSTWLPKLSRRGVVLFHDTEVREGNFGVWRLWDEVSSRYPSFLFRHSYGLGVLGVGLDVADGLSGLFALASAPEATARIRTLFATRGDALVEHLLRTQAEGALTIARTEFERRDAAFRHQAAVQLKSALASAQREAAGRARAAAELQQALARELMHRKIEGADNELVPATKPDAEAGGRASWRQRPALMRFLRRL